MKLLPEQCRAARGLLDWTQARLAERAAVSRSTVRDFECGRRALHRSTETQIVAALEAEGVRLLPPDGDGPGEGPGVRLTRSSAVGARATPLPG